MNENQRDDRFPWNFFVITFGISWLIWLPGVLVATNIIVLQFSDSMYGILNLIGGFGPTITGFLLVYLRKGKDGVKELIRSVLNYKDIGKIWWIPLILLIPAIDFCAFILNIISGGTVPETPYLMQPWIIPIYFIGSLLPFANSFREEFGWRGYALDKIQMKQNALFSSIIVGFFWGIWHLPLYFFPTSQIIYVYVPFWLLTIQAIILSCFITWLYNNTNGSMLTALILHAVINFSGMIFPNYLTEFGQIYALILKIIIITCVVIIFGYKQMVFSISRFNERLRKLC